jgi:hypothetical protein
MKILGILGLGFVVVACAAPTSESDDVPTVELSTVRTMEAPECPSPLTLPVVVHTTDPNNPCDWSIREHVNSSIEDMHVLRAKHTGTVAPVTSQALCNASRMTVVAWGQRGGYYTFDRMGNPVWHAGGQWDMIAAANEYGTWSGSGNCVFPGFQTNSGLGPGGIPVYPADHPSGPGWAYLKVRSASQSVIYAGAGPVSMNILTSLNHI